MPTWEQRLGIAEWEPKQMTVCIAAICDKGHAIVLVADKQFGIGISNIESPDGKYMSLWTDWHVGLAGTVSHATDVIAAARRVTPESLSADDVKPALEASYRRARINAASALYLGNRGWTLEEFKNEGKNRLPVDRYATIDTQIALLDYDADLIVAGFGENDLGPSILTVKNPGICTDHTKLGFWCVGSGSTPAQMSLFNRNYSWLSTPEHAAYLIYEAKLSAERATGVGRKTDLVLIRKGKDPLAIEEDTEKQLQRIADELKPKEFDEKHQAILRGCRDFAIFKDF